MQKNVSKEFMCISEHTVPESANANVIRQLGNHHRLAHTYTINQLRQWASHNGLYFSNLYQNAEKFLNGFDAFLSPPSSFSLEI